MKEIRRNNMGISVNDAKVEELAKAAKAENSAKIKELVAAGTDINLINSHGWTALMNVAYNWEKNAVILLINEGASPEISGDPHNTARSLAKEGTSTARNWYSDGYREKMSSEILAILDSAPKGIQTQKTTITSNRIRYGGFGEPYCSQKCYEKAGEVIFVQSMKGASGICVLCKCSVNQSFNAIEQNVFFPFRGQLLHICNSCLSRGKDYVKKIEECCMCGKSVLREG